MGMTSKELKDLELDRNRLYVMYTIRSNSDILYYRGAKFWKWTKNPRRAAMLSPGMWQIVTASKQHELSKATIQTAETAIKVFEKMKHANL